MARAPLSAGRHGPLRGVLSGYRFGVGDPTTRLADGEFWRATITPAGPGTLHLRWSADDLTAAAWGPGADWLLAQVPAMTGANDPGHRFEGAHPAIMAAQRNHPDVRFGASGTLYHELLPVILGQRITAGEALRQWHQLVYRLGEAAPGPNTRLRLPPEPTLLAARPAWWFHPLGIEAKRADAVRTVAKYAAQLHDWSALPNADAATKLALLPGVGQWTIGSVLATSHADPDALAVGDFHLKNVITHALAGRARGTDEEMLALLAPYAGQRGRAARLLLLDGHRAPKFGPRQRVLPMSRW
ncbi:MAG: DNA-3-methyladenine glycosylase 2 family protein [Ilumatobacteraceae bacterium]